MTSSPRHGLRVGRLIEQLRASLWFIPALAVAAACAAAGVLNGVQVDDTSPLSHVVFPGGADGARGILQTIAGSVITVTGVVFSLTVVTLQLASTQFSPRLLRTFLRDVSNQVVLATFLATFAYCLVALRGVQSATDDRSEVVPALAVSGAYVLTAASVVALVFFIDHIARSIRIDSLMREVNEDTEEVVGRITDGDEVQTDEVPECRVAVPAPSSGFVQGVDVDRLLSLAVEHDCTLRVHPLIGERVIAGAPLLWARTRSGADLPPGLAPAAADAVQVGYERTMQQDVAFGLRQLVDIAVKALSPGVNDPTTAVHAIGHLAHLLVRLSDAPNGDQVLRDRSGAIRLIVPRRSFSSYLGLACDQIRRYGAAEPAVTEELLRLVLDVARADDPRRHGDAILRQADLVVTAAERETAEPRDLTPLHELREEIERVVARRS